MQGKLDSTNNSKLTSANKLQVGTKNSSNPKVILNPGLSYSPHCRLWGCYSYLMEQQESEEQRNSQRAASEPTYPSNR